MLNLHLVGKASGWIAAGCDGIIGYFIERNYIALFCYTFPPSYWSLNHFVYLIDLALVCLHLTKEIGEILLEFSDNLSMLMNMILLVSNHKHAKLTFPEPCH